MPSIEVKIEMGDRFAALLYLASTSRATSAIPWKNLTDERKEAWAVYAAEVVRRLSHINETTEQPGNVAARSTRGSLKRAVAAAGLGRQAR